MLFLLLCFYHFALTRCSVVNMNHFFHKKQHSPLTVFLLCTRSYWLQCILYYLYLIRPLIESTLCSVSPQRNIISLPQQEILLTPPMQQPVSIYRFPKERRILLFFPAQFAFWLQANRLLFFVHEKLIRHIVPLKREFRSLMQYDEL